LVSAWNVKDIPQMALPPCHFAFQCVVLGGRLHMKVFIRSLDVFLGAPFDIASYAFLLHMIAEVTDMTPGELVISSTDTHLYLNHMEQAVTQLKREPKALPWYEMSNPPDNIDGFTHRHLAESIHDYYSHDAIKAPIAV
jgi:thymidylate synthase